MKPTFVDFSADPPLLGNAEFSYQAVQQTPGHLTMDRGGTVDIRFQVAHRDPALETEMTLEVTALVSKNNEEPGFAPMDVLVNDQPVISDWRIPGGGDQEQVNRFAVPGRFLRTGENTLSIRCSERATMMLWLYRITLDAVYDRDKSSKEMHARDTADEVFVYRTEVRAIGDVTWNPQPDLELYLGMGEPRQVRLSNLSWQEGDGTQVAVGFGTADFRGSRRSPAGELQDFRGELLSRVPIATDAPPADAVEFNNRFDWGDGWYDAGRLLLLFRNGDRQPTTLTWRNAEGEAGAIQFDSNRTRLAGYHHARNEGPVAYDGEPTDPKLRQRPH
ncbi:hypothetical protein [Streptomyces sp. NPDC001787]|uniref:hypothetical protein n=1 Tax=Streptomyces sp. NPDC001787 TaxID=3154523 RepID=UPI003322F92A